MALSIFHDPFELIIPEQDRETARQKQNTAYVRVIPMNLAGYLLATITAAFVVKDDAPLFIILSWLLIAFLMSYFRLIFLKNSNFTSYKIRGHVAYNKYYSSVMAVIWGIYINLCLPYLNSGSFLACFILSLSLMNGAMRSVYVQLQVAILHIVILSISVTILSYRLALNGDMLSGSFYSLVNTVLTLLAVYGSRKQYEVSLTSILSKIENERNVATVRLLLDDYEEHGSGWLWHIDSNKCLINVSSKMLIAIKKSHVEIVNTTLTDHLDASNQTELLIAEINDHRSFKNMVAPISIDGEVRWWSISARASFSNGEFLGMRGIAVDATEEHHTKQSLKKLSQYDVLTGLPNQESFHNALSFSLKQKRKIRQTAVLLVSIDQLKIIYDTLGHPVGDKLVKHIAERLEKFLGGDNFLARFSGGEFAVLINEIGSVEQLSSLAQNIITNLQHLVIISGHQMLPTVCIGIAISPNDGVNVVSIIKNSSFALNQAHKSGRSLVSFFDASMEKSAHVRREIELDLILAIKNKEFVLAYQPIVDLESQNIVSYESLIRWHHPKHGSISPLDFIPIAEESGLICEIGEWAICEAVFEAVNWPDQISISINLSPVQLSSPSLLSCIKNIIAESGISPSRIDLEITEGVFLENSDNNLQKLHDLRSIGINISLDDFGTGYSSFNYVQTFPFSKLKLDKIFVDKIVGNVESVTIVKAIIDMSGAMGIMVTAEGIETTEQLNILKSIGCTFGQGYLFSAAVASSEIHTLQKLMYK